jgi:hypothetical protein
MLSFEGIPFQGDIAITEKLVVCCVSVSLWRLQLKRWCTVTAVSGCQAQHKYL